jgi:hypothetical protein
MASDPGHQRGQAKVVAWVGDDGADKIDLSAEVVSFTVARDIRQPTASFSLTLLPRQGGVGDQTPSDIRRTAELYKRLRANTVVAIGFEQHGGIMAGLVGKRNKQVRMSGPQAGYGLTITGKCIGKGLVNDHVVLPILGGPGFDKWVTAVRAAFGEGHPLESMIFRLMGPEVPDETATSGVTRSWVGVRVQDVVDYLLEEATTMRVPLLSKLLGGDGRLSDYIETEDTVTTWHDDRVYNEGMQSASGSVMGLISQILDRDFYEIRVDYIPSEDRELPRAVLIVRPKPFDEELMKRAPVTTSPGNSWEDMRCLVTGEPFHTIELNDVIQANLGVADDEGYALFVAQSRRSLIGNPSEFQNRLGYPLLDLWAARKFGLQAYNTSLNLVGSNTELQRESPSEYDRILGEEVADARNRLFNWYGPLSELEAGNVVVRGRDHYRVGDKVRLPWSDAPRGDSRGLDYYTLGVTHQWTFGNPYLCTLALARGHNAEMTQDWLQEVNDAVPDVPGSYVDISILDGAPPNPDALGSDITFRTTAADITRPGKFGENS